MLKRRLVYLVVFAIWLCLVSLPFLTMVVAFRGEFTLGNEMKSHLRTFLVQGEESNGLGFEWSRRSGTDKTCQKISVRYFLWDGSAEAGNTDFCQCTGQDDGRVQFADSC